MKFSSVVATACAIVPVFGSALPSDAQALENRPNYDGSKAIINSINIIINATNNVDIAAKNVTIQGKKSSQAGLEALFALSQQIDILNPTIKNQTAVVKKAKKLESCSIPKVRARVATLIKAIRNVAKDTNAARPVFEDNGIESAVPGIVSIIQKNSNGYADALISKVPKANVAEAKQQKADVNAAFQMIYDVYGEPPTN